MYRKIFVIILLLIVFYIESAFGQLLENNILEEISNQFRFFSDRWRPVIYRAAYALFGSLALIEICWTGIILFLKQADFQEIIGEVVKRILFIGFFLFLLEYSDQIAYAIVESFQQLARDASRNAGGAVSISPSNIFDSGLDIVKFIIQMMSKWNPIPSLGYLIAGIIIIVCYALIAAMMMVGIVEMYIVFNAGIILLGFGASRYTKEYALCYIRYAVSVGVKLFIIQLIVGLGNAIIKDWVSQFSEVTNIQVLVLIGASVVFLSLVKTIPSIVSGILNGTSFSSGDALISVAQSTASAGASVVGGVASGAMAVTQAAMIAEKSVGKGFVDKVGAGSRALAGATVQSIGHRLANKTLGGELAKKMRKSSKKKD